ncbi:MAG: desulfoferrodoxin family protein [Sphaerochaetaceae bacterium]
MEVTFYLCEKCGNVVELIHNGGGELVCCGEPMKKLEAQTADAAGEKHVPIYRVEGDKTIVTVGTTLHPMVEKHYIMWIAALTEEGIYRKALKPEEKPEVTFDCLGKVVAFYEYCNIHGLWRAEA